MRGEVRCGKPPESCSWLILLWIIQTSYLIAEQAIVIEIIRLAIPVGIQGIHDAIRIRIKELDYPTVQFRHPDTPIPVISTDRHCHAHRKSQEVIHPGDDRFRKFHPFCTIHRQIHTVGIGGIGRELGRHGCRSRELRGPRSNSGQLLEGVAVFVHEIGLVVTGKDRGGRAGAH